MGTGQLTVSEAMDRAVWLQTESGYLSNSHVEFDMTEKIQATFTTRRDAEMAVEHLVQEHGVDPAGIMLIADRDENTAGTEAAGSDLADGQPKRIRSESPHWQVACG